MYILQPTAYLQQSLLQLEVKTDTAMTKHMFTSAERHAAVSRCVFTCTSLLAANGPYITYYELRLNASVLKRSMTPIASISEAV